MPPQHAELHKIRILFERIPRKDIVAQNGQIRFQIFAEEPSQHHVTVEGQPNVVDGNGKVPEHIQEELYACAKMVSALDDRMLSLNDEIMAIAGEEMEEA